LDPSKGLSNESLEIAKSRNDGSFIEDWFGISPQNFIVLSSLAIAGIASINYIYFKKMK
jgi:hypothetical protein